jgi:[NiFe] hydrogenase diaphorase moiety small subunit
MSDRVTLTIDNVQLQGRPGQTILEAAEEAGIYIPRLCHLKGLQPFGSCRVCTVLVNGRPQAACTQPISQGMVIESSTEQVMEIRKDLIDMLFVEGNHFCMFCEKSGNCELQAMAYRFGITAPRYPNRAVDASHPDIMIDHNRCIRCARCVRASRDLDGKEVFGFVNRGPHKELAVNAAARLVDTNVDVTDQAINVCPVGALLKKRTGYAIPIGQRKYDHTPIGSEIENAGSQ